MMEAQEFDEIVQGVTLHCDYTIANGADEECGGKAAYHFTYHQCNEELLCEAHAVEFIAQLIGVLARYGSAFCTDCQTEYTRLVDFVTVTEI